MKGEVLGRGMCIYLAKCDMMICGRVPFISFVISVAASRNNSMVFSSGPVATGQTFKSAQVESC